MCTWGSLPPYLADDLIAATRVAVLLRAGARGSDCIGLTARQRALRAYLSRRVGGDALDIAERAGGGRAVNVLARPDCSGEIRASDSEAAAESVGVELKRCRCRVGDTLLGTVAHALDDRVRNLDPVAVIVAHIWLTLRYFDRHASSAIALCMCTQ